MKLLVRLLKVVGLLAGVLVVGIGALLAVSFSGLSPIKDGQRA